MAGNNIVASSAWSQREFVLMQAKAIELNARDYLAIITVGRYAGLRLEECFRIDTNDANNALKTGLLHVKGKGGLHRAVPINVPIEAVLKEALSATPTGHKLFVSPNDKTHLAMKRFQAFIAYHRWYIQDANRERPITFHGLRHTYAYEKYKEFIEKGFSDFISRKKVSELLGHHRDDVTRIYLSKDKL